MAAGFFYFSAIESYRQSIKYACNLSHMVSILLKVISKIVDHGQGHGENRFGNGAYTTVFEAFETVFNKDLGR